MKNGRFVGILQSTINQLKEKDTIAPQSTYSTLDSVLQLIGMVILLVLILVAAYYTTKYIGGLKFNQYKDSNFKVIDTYRISQNKVLQIVKVGTKYLVIALGKDSIQYLTELEETDLVRKETSNENTKLDFKQILEKMKSKNMKSND